MMNPEDSNSRSENAAGNAEFTSRESNDEEGGKDQFLHHKETPFGRFESLLWEAAFVIVSCSTQLMTQAQLAQAIAPLFVIGDGFQIENPGQLSWFSASYSLTVGTFVLVAGRLGDIFGHKALLLAGFFWCSLWSLLSGISVYSNQVFFDCCRAFQGIGMAFALPNAIATIGRNYPPGKRKNMAFGMFGASAPTGFELGAVFSSLLTQLAWWPWAYWITAIVCFGFGCVGYVVVPRDPKLKVETEHPLWERIDVLGAVTGISGLVLFNFSWNQAPVVSWITPYTYILLIVGAALLAVFTFIERKAKFPLLPLTDLSSDAAFVLACLGVGWSSFGIWIYYSWLFMLRARGQSPLLSSAQFAPVVPSGWTAAMTTGFVLGRYSAKAVMLFSMVAFTVGNILIATAPVHRIYWAQMFVSNIVMPWGMDMSFPAATIILSNSLPYEHQGLAASLVATVVNYSISIGLGLAGTVETRVNDGGRKFLKGYRGAWYVGIGLSSFGIVVAATYVFGKGTRTKIKSRYKKQRT